MGRLPTALRAEVETVWIHKGVEPFGGGNYNLLIHTSKSGLYEADGILDTVEATIPNRIAYFDAQAFDV